MRFSNMTLIKSFFLAYLQCFRSVVTYYAGVMAGGKFARGVAGEIRTGIFLQLYEYTLGCPDVFIGLKAGKDFENLIHYP